MTGMCDGIHGEIETSFCGSKNAHASQKQRKESFVHFFGHFSSSGLFQQIFSQICLSTLFGSIEVHSNQIPDSCLYIFLHCVQTDGDIGDKHHDI